jgi:hypothetical protein
LDRALTSVTPTYQQLLARTDAPAGSSWGLWGADDELGTLNYLTPSVVRAAVALVRTGERVNLDRSLPTVAGAADDVPTQRRGPAAHHVFAMGASYLDDRLDSFFLQGSSQIDALRHTWHHEHGFYNGKNRRQMVATDPTLGINRIAETGIVGRGVLLDVERFMRMQGRDYDPGVGSPIDVATLESIRQAQGITFATGDILLLRTGGTYGAPGLEQSRDMLAWLWDNEFAMIASDNASVEVWPVVETTPFMVGDGDDPADGMMHPTLIGLLGLALGELWELDRLGELCARERRYEFLLTAKPLNVVGGVGSPPNAMVIF